MQRSHVYYKCPNCGQEMRVHLGGRPVKTPVENTGDKTPQKPICHGCGHGMNEVGRQDIPEIGGK